MAQGRGAAARLAFQQETTYGSVPSPIALRILPMVSGNPIQTRNLFTSQVLTTDRNPRKPVRGNVAVAATIPTELSPQMGPVLKAVLGASTPTGGPAYIHTIKIGSSVPSYLFELGYTDLAKYLVYLGCKINKLTLTVTSEGFQALSIDLMGQCECEGLDYDAQSATFNLNQILTGGTSTHKATILGDLDNGTAGTLILFNHDGDFQNNETITDDGGVPGSATADGILGDSSLDSSVTDPGHTPFDGFSISSVKEGGSIIAIVSRVDGLSLENNIDGDNYVIGGGGRRRNLPEGVLKVSGTLVALFESMALYHKAVRNTESSLEIIYKFGTGEGSAGNEQLKITIPELNYAPVTPPVEGPAGIKVSLPFEAFYDNDSEASAIWMELKNAEATI